MTAQPPRRPILEACLLRSRPHPIDKYLPGRGALTLRHQLQWPRSGLRDSVPVIARWAPGGLSLTPA